MNQTIRSEYLIPRPQLHGDKMPVQDTNNFVITGIPRSGTSLLCKLVNHIENVVCFNELGPFYNVNSLPAVFHHVRSELKNKALMPMPVSSDTGEEITDTQSENYERRFVEVDIDPEKKLAIGSKINVPYLLQIETILSYGYKVIFVTRDPVYAIASWNMHKNINEQYVMDSDFAKWPRYSKFDFKSSDRIGRQIELYNRLVSIIESKTDQSILLRYEDIVEDPKDQLGWVGMLLDVNIELKKELPELKNLNRDSRFPGIDLDEIREKLDV